ncbi:MAG: YciE/YciF ferroxidase family protein [Bacteroidia bacterium]
MQSKNSRSKKGADKKNSDSGSMQSTQLMDLFENELKDIYWAEKALTKALPKMAKNATDQELAEAIENHLEETLEQVEKLERVFELIEVKPVAKKCEAMAGLLKEGEEIMKDTEKGPQRDAGIISAAQKVEHYEIASYGTLRTFATTLGLDEAAEILEEILEEEKKADETLSEIAKSTINVEALEEEAEEETGEE